jgi:hypothetical protein
MAAHEEETISVVSNPVRSSRSEYYSGKYEKNSLMGSPRQSISSKKSKFQKQYLVLDDMTVIEYTSDKLGKKTNDRNGGLSSKN